MIIMTTPNRALVLSGGGTGGAAWMAGFISALQAKPAPRRSPGTLTKINNALAVARWAPTSASYRA
jgi:hypothetical protein